MLVGRTAESDVVVVGASAGGVNALKTVFRSFQPVAPVTVFVVLHTSPRGESSLPAILQKQTSLHVAHAVDRTPIETGKIYVAPPDRHLVLEVGHMHLSAGPKENRTRPAINVLFRSAATVYGARVIGVILSGALDDGTAGLWEIKRRGGVTVVQEPEDAEHSQMPGSAIANVKIDYRIPAAEMGALLSSLVKKRAERALESEDTTMAEKTALTCPDCHGPIERSWLGRFPEYRCRVGHIYSPQNMLAAHQESEERTLWSAIESLEEGADLAEELGYPQGNGPTDPRAIAEAKRHLAQTIRTGIERANQKRVLADK